MKLTKSLFIFSALTILLNSCGTFSEVGSVMRNQKSKSTDEFLIKKKEPLTQPPDYQTIPEPGSTADRSNSEKKQIEKILNSSQAEITKSKSSSVESSILNQIKSEKK